MKKTVIMFLCVLLVSVNIFAEEKKTSSDQEKYFAMAKVPPLADFKYELTEDLEGVKIIKYTGNSIHLRIPDTIEDMPVLELGKYLFSDKKTMKTVVMPDTIKKAGWGLFADCKALKNVKLSSAITNIAGSMFYGCESLTEFIIPDHITNIESGAFCNSGLKSIYLPDRITFQSKDDSGNYVISYHIFKDCKNLQEVRLPSKITDIGEEMFSGCTSLSNIVLPEGLITIENSAFSGCSSLTELNIPNTVTTILSGAFDEYGGKKLIIPDSVTVLECSFERCKNLEYLRLSNSLTEIGYHYNDYRTKYFPDTLVSVNLPESLQRIHRYSFRGLSSLKELIIPDSITQLEFDYYYDGDIFLGTNLPLLTQKRLKQLGYKGRFSE